MKTITGIGLIALFLCGFSTMKAQVPPTAPPDLPYPSEDVLSFFSEKYGEAFPTMETIWGPTSSWSYTATGDDAAGLIEIKDLDWLPIRLNGSAQLKNYYYVHIDVYCNEETDFRIGFHRHYPDTKEQYFPMIEKGSIAPGKWYSIDYSLDDFFLAGWEAYDAHYLRFGGEVDLNGYKPQWSNQIYITNFVLFNGEPECLGGVVRDGSSVKYVKDDNNSFDAFIKNGSLNYSAQETIGQINIYSVTGQSIASFNAGNAMGSYDVSHVPSGVYVVSAAVGDGKIVTKRIVK